MRKANWTTASLSSIGTIVTGKTPSIENARYWDGDIPFVTPADFDGHPYVADTERYVTKEGARIARLLPPGAVLVTCIGNIGKVLIAPCDVATNQQINAVICHGDFVPEFVAGAIALRENDLRGLAGMTTLPIVNAKNFGRLSISHPPKKQQQRIAEILSTIDEAIEQTEALIAKTQQIKAGLMHDLFTRGVTADGQLRPPREEAPQLYHKWAPEYVPSTWSRERLGDVTPESSPICYGIVQPGEHKPEGIPVVAIYNLNADFTTIHKSSSEIENAYVRSRIRGGDVLLSIKGSIGRVDVTPTGFIGNISRDVARIRPRPDVHPRYLRYALESPYLQSTLARISVGTTRAELSIGRLKQVHIYLPPEPEQAVIADRLAFVDESIQAERGALTKLREQKLGLMADLLTGRVLVSRLGQALAAEVDANV